MTQIITKKPIRLFNGGDVSTIIVRLDRLEEVRGLLDANAIVYRIDDETLSVDEEPEVAFIDISNFKYDPIKVQAIVDGIP